MNRRTTSLLATLVALAVAIPAGTAAASPTCLMPPVLQVAQDGSADVASTCTAPSDAHAVVVTAPSHGTVEVTGATLRYRPQAGYSGADSFAYAVGTDADGYTNVTQLVQVNAPAGSWTFTPTEVAPTPTPPTVQSPAPAVAAAATLGATTRLSRGTLRVSASGRAGTIVTVSCPTACRVRPRLSLVLSGGGRPATTIGVAVQPMSLKAGGSGEIALRLDARTRRALASGRRGKLRIAVVVETARGARTTSAVVSLTR